MRDLRSKDWASDGNESSVDLARSVGSLDNGVGGQESDVRAGRDVAVLGVRDQSREGLDRELDVASWARHDEGGGQGVDLVEGEGGVEGSREWALAESGTDVGGVTGLNGQDRTSGGQVGSGHDVGCGTEVGTDTNTLENGRGSNEGLGVRDTKVVHALSDGLSTSFGESSGQERNVGGLVRGDLLEVGVEVGIEPGSGEVGLGVVGKTLTVEFVLEVLQGQSIVEDISVSDLGSSLTDLLEAFRVSSVRVFPQRSIAVFSSKRLTYWWWGQQRQRQRMLRQRMRPS